MYYVYWIPFRALRAPSPMDTNTITLRRVARGAKHAASIGYCQDTINRLDMMVAGYSKALGYGVLLVNDVGKI